MTLKHRLPARNKYECDTCGKIDFWGDTWCYFGSIMDMDERPDEVPTLCSNKCRDEFEKKRKSGEVEVVESD